MGRVWRPCMVLASVATVVQQQAATMATHTRLHSYSTKSLRYRPHRVPATTRTAEASVLEVASTVIYDRSQYIAPTNATCSSRAEGRRSETPLRMKERVEMYSVPVFRTAAGAQEPQIPSAPQCPRKSTAAAPPVHRSHQPPGELRRRLPRGLRTRARREAALEQTSRSRGCWQSSRLSGSSTATQTSQSSASTVAYRR